MGRWFQVRAGSPLVGEDDPGYSFFVLVRGQMRVTRGGTLLGIRGAGECLAETGFLRRSGARRFTTLTAVTDCTVIEFDPDVLWLRGATVAAWYPITPSSSMAEAFSRHCRKFRAIRIPARPAMRSCRRRMSLPPSALSSGRRGTVRAPSPAPPGPGISLMQEFIGLAYFAEIPAVIFDVQRAGPSTGMPTRNQQCDLMACAYASHGDTKHVLLFPEDPKEGFEFAAQAFDLADRLQTPVFVLLDLDIGMNERLCEPLKWDDAHRFDRGKVLSYADLEAGKRFGRYLDVDADGITWRTYPGAHPKRGSFFTRGTSRDRYARYTEEGSAYVDNMQRLLKKFETAKDFIPRPVQRKAGKGSRFGVIYYGSTAPAMDEAMYLLDDESMHVDALRVRAFPFQDEVLDFVNHHDHVFVVEQNRDGQLRTLLVAEGMLPGEKLTPVLHYDGTPITARFIHKEISQRLSTFNVTPIKRRTGTTDEHR